MSTDLMKTNNAAALMTPEERRASVLARAKAIREGNTDYKPFEGGVNYIRLDGNTGDLTYGKEQTPLPEGQNFAIALDSITHGVVNWFNSQPQDRRMASYLDGAAPTMPQGGQPAGHDGKTRNGWSFTITIPMVGIPGGGSEDLTGSQLSFDCANTSKLNAAQDLIGVMTAMTETPLGQRGFFNPVINLKVGSYWNKTQKKDVYFPIFDIIGWTDGTEIVSASGGPQLASATPGGDTEEDAAAAMFS